MARGSWQNGRARGIVGGIYGAFGIGVAILGGLGLGRGPQFNGRIVGAIVISG
jgi:hypothetical protein